MPHPPSSQRHIKILAQRSLAVVPNDQLRLLALPSSWVSDSKKAIRDGSLVPAHVLDTVKQAYQACKSIDDGEEASDDREEDVDNLREDAVAGRQSPQESLPHSRQQPSPAALPSYSSYPELTHPSPVDTIQRAFARPQDLVFPARGLGRGPRLHQDPNLDAIPSSSDQQEMELVTPQGQPHSDLRVNKEATRLFPMPTSSPADSLHSNPSPPPCAQPEDGFIPDSMAADAFAVSAASRLGEQADQLRNQNCQNDAVVASKLTHGVGCSPHSFSPNSVIPATCSDSSNQNAPASHSIPPSLHPSIPEADNSASRAVAGGSNLDATNEPETASLLPIQTWNLAPGKGPNPYEIFIGIYSDYPTQYSGSLRSFVKASVCLELLQNERSLRECLYDDFIRAFSGAYLKYVANAGPGQEPLPAVEWFNGLSGAAVYSCLVVTRENLGSILDWFPEEVERTRKIIQDCIADAGRERALSVELPSNPAGQSTSCGLPAGSTEADPSQTASSEWPHSQPRSPPLSQVALPRSPPDPETESWTAAAMTSSASVLTGSPRASQYLKWLAAGSQSGSGRKRSAEEQARLREHFRKRKKRPAINRQSIDRPADSQNSGS